MAREALNSARTDFAEFEADFVKNMGEIGKQLLSNIQSYYSSLTGYYDALAQNTAATRQNVSELSGYIGNGTRIISLFGQEISQSAKSSQKLNE